MIAEIMDDMSEFDDALWETRVVESDFNLVIRTDNVRTFYCEISPSQFLRSPLVKKVMVPCFYKCFNILFGPAHAKKKVEARKKLAHARTSPPPPRRHSSLSCMVLLAKETE